MTTLTKAAQGLLEKLTNLIQCCSATRELMLSDCPWEAQLMQTEVLAKQAKEQLVALEQTAGFPENLAPEIRSQLKDLLAMWSAALDSLHTTAKDLFHRTEASINEEF
jgi:hypothetical protein